MKSLTTSIAAAIYILSISGSVSAQDFLLHDGDTVVFLGDSITAARGYTKIIEHYSLMRFPDRRMQFYNAGKGGDTAQSSLQRLERDVFARDATVMIVALGVNDIGWGARADEEHKQRYLEGIKRLIQECHQRNIRAVSAPRPLPPSRPQRPRPAFSKAWPTKGSPWPNHWAPKP